MTLAARSSVCLYLSRRLAGNIATELAALDDTS